MVIPTGKNHNQGLCFATAESGEVCVLRVLGRLLITWVDFGLLRNVMCPDGSEYHFFHLQGDIVVRVGSEVVRKNGIHHLFGIVERNLAIKNNGKGRELRLTSSQ
jgi:hypothetical protein